MDTSQLKVFKGLPSPASALFIASLPLILKNDLYVLNYETIYLQDFILNPLILICVSIILTLLLVSNIPMYSIKFSGFNWHDNYLKYIIIVFFIISFIFLYFIAIPITLFIYVILSIIFRKRIVKSA